MTAMFDLAGKAVWVAGDQGMVGRAIVRRLSSEPCSIIASPTPRLDLRRQQPVFDFVAEARPDVIFLAAARVGGINANNRLPGEFLYDNLAIAANVVEAARRAGTAKLIFLGSSCIYPKFAAQPMAEDALLTGPLEPTNEWYAIAKIAGIKLCQAYRRQYGCDFIAAQPTNLYGPFDNFDLNSSHVLPALLRKAHEARVSGAPEMVVWGSGRPMRELLHVDDLADALVYLTRHHSAEEIVNVGSNEECSIADLAHLVAKTVGYSGSVVFDPSMPDGTPRKLLDSGKLRSMGWQARTTLEDGLRETYHWYLEHRRLEGNESELAPPR